MKKIVSFIVACLLSSTPFPADAEGEGETRGRDPEAVLRNRMVDEQIAGRGISDPAVLGAMRKVPRHEFVPEAIRNSAYEDRPLPIGHGQTISQPYIVAFMTEVLKPSRNMRILEIGTGSGYQAAVLAELAGEVYTVEIVKDLADAAARRLAGLGCRSVTVRAGDGYYGWKEKAPFDAIIVTAAAEHVPPALVEQLANGGRIVIPIGGIFEVQALVLVTKSGDGRSTTRKVLLPVRFVPLTGAGLRN